MERSVFQDYIDEAEQAIRLLRRAEDIFDRLNTKPPITQETLDLCKRIVRMVDEGKIEVVD